MKIVNKATADLKPYDKNAKKHDKTQIANVAESIKQFGFVQPCVLDKDNTVIIGHCRLEAAKKLNLEEVPCVMVDDLTDEQVKALRIADNKTNESEWINDILRQELLEVDLSAFDFDFGLGEKGAKEETEGEVEFSEILGEENNYIVLQFKTDVDWLYAQSVFGLETVKSYSTRKDGEVKKNMERRGVARVLDGAKALNEILGDEI